MPAGRAMWVGGPPGGAADFPSRVEISRENRSYRWGEGLSLALRMRAAETVSDDERGDLTWRRPAN